MKAAKCKTRLSDFMGVASMGGPCMRRKLRLTGVVWSSVVAFFLFRETLTADSELVTPAAVQERDRWSQQHILGEKPVLPFSFIYGGRDSGELLSQWKLRVRSRNPGAGRTERSMTWSDPATGMVVRCESVEYTDYPAVEWIVYFRNTGIKDTLILKEIQGLDTRFEKSGNGEFLLHCNKGDFCAMDSYEPYQVSLTPGLEQKFGPPDASGKSCDGPRGWPYYNLQMPGGGLILAIGWPGQWASSFKRGDANSLRIVAGQQTTHLSLKPGEEIRTPLIAMVFYSGDDLVQAQNLWRRWFVAHNMPRARGKLPPPMISTCPSPLAEQSEVNCRAVTEIIAAPGSKLTALWVDAGWYPCDNGTYAGSDRWLNTGTWIPDPVRLPNGFSEFTEKLHANGKQFILWFEPERVGDTNSWLARARPDWLLPGTSHGALLNLGNPEALQWLINHVSGMIRSEGIDWYREDMNGGGPLPACRKHDVSDRQGMTENLYVQGHLAFWDQLRLRHPGLFIDSCASGGRRNDLESMRRAVPLCRTDFVSKTRTNALATQSQTLALAAWLPYYGNAGFFAEPFMTRSYYAPSMTPWDGPTVSGAQQAYDECSRVAHLMLGDFYPLTPYSLKDDVWLAWQFDRPDLGEGVVQVFRRPDSGEQSMNFKLRGLESKARFEVENFDGGKEVRTGRELMQQGLTVTLKEKPSAAVIAYRSLR